MEGYKLFMISFFIILSYGQIRWNNKERHHSLQINSTLENNLPSPIPLLIVMDGNETWDLLTSCEIFLF